MDILFWSGGKDAYLALEFYRQQNPETKIKLLTTFEGKSEIVPHQNIPIENIKKQAETLNLNLSLIPLPKNCPNNLYLKKVSKALNHQSKPVEHLLFGDWYLQDIREWREEQFNELGYECRFPIWKESLHNLLPILLLKPVEIHISAVDDKFKKYIRIGERYNQHFVQQLPKEIDPMGENGEFHTEVVFKEWDEDGHVEG
jgi:diphthamide synthase (EF-2-diphthine--ammonia ligase)